VKATEASAAIGTLLGGQLEADRSAMGVTVQAYNRTSKRPHRSWHRPPNQYKNYVKESIFFPFALSDDTAEWLIAVNYTARCVCLPSTPLLYPPLLSRPITSSQPPPTSFPSPIFPCFFLSSSSDICLNFSLVNDDVNVK
jgi:hypothetical protein